MLEIRYVWEWPVRITHWVNVLCIAVLSVTGYYIGTPFYTATSTDQWLMGWNRFLHFTFGYLFALSVLSRLIWMVLGNRHASWRAFVPWKDRHGRQGAVRMFKYYTFLSPEIPYEVGHNALAAIAYSAIFFLFFLQILSGFALYGQFAPGGSWDLILGWFRTGIGIQALRLVHHLVMWLLIAFAIHHVYSAWLMDVKERNGTMSSIFGGCKYIEPEDVGK